MSPSRWPRQKQRSRAAPLLSCPREESRRRVSRAKKSVVVESAGPSACICICAYAYARMHMYIVESATSAGAPLQYSPNRSQTLPKGLGPRRRDSWTRLQNGRDSKVDETPKMDETPNGMRLQRVWISREVWISLQIWISLQTGRRRKKEISSGGLRRRLHPKAPSLRVRQTRHRCGFRQTRPRCGFRQTRPRCGFVKRALAAVPSSALAALRVRQKPLYLLAAAAALMSAIFCI